METIINARAIILMYAYLHKYRSKISIDNTWKSASLAYWIMSGCTSCHQI